MTTELVVWFRNMIIIHLYSTVITVVQMTGLSRFYKIRQLGLKVESAQE